MEILQTPGLNCWQFPSKTTGATGQFDMASNGMAGGPLMVPNSLRFCDCSSTAKRCYGVFSPD